VKRNNFIGLLIAVLLFGNIVIAAPVPDTGQTKCYDVSGNVITCPSPGQALYGQDANYAVNPMSYSKLDANGNVLPDSAKSWFMVKDNVTGLIWEMKTNKDDKENYEDPHDADNTYTWYDSNPATNGGYPGNAGDGKNTENFIKSLNNSKFGGYSDWRMPTARELLYIEDYSIPYPGLKVNAGYFPNTVSGSYWSSTTEADSKYSALCLDFNDYYNGSFSKSARVYSRAVRGEQSGSFNTSDSDDLGEMVSTGTYTDNGDGTVTDVSTGLMWQQDSPTEIMAWEAALAYCEGLNLGKYADWRLPNKKELLSLVDYSRYHPAINISFFPNTVSDFYWSSTTYVDNTDLAFGVDFSRFSYVAFGKDSNNYVRAVRGGQSGLLAISPSSRSVIKDAGSTTFSVSNSGTGSMNWAATVTSGGSWMSITSGASGTNTGTITCAYTTNTGAARSGTIRVTATGATGSPKDVTVTQAGMTTSAQVTSLWSVNNAHAGSTNTLWADVKNTGSSALPSNALVWYYVSGPNWTNYWVGYASVSGLSSGSTKWYSYNWPIPSTATPGTYTYWARVYQGSTALSNWSAAQSFTVGVNQKAVMISPVNGSKLASTTQTFTWTSVSGATQYWLSLGSTIGGTNIYNQATGTSTSRTVTGLPSNGSMIYARLWTQYGGVWFYNDYSYKSY
jgi:hypothetical protein